MFQHNLKSLIGRKGKLVLSSLFIMAIASTLFNNCGQDFRADFSAVPLDSMANGANVTNSSTFGYYPGQPMVDLGIGLEFGNPSTGLNSGGSVPFLDGYLEGVFGDVIMGWVCNNNPNLKVTIEGIAQPILIGAGVTVIQPLNQAEALDWTGSSHLCGNTTDRLKRFILHLDRATFKKLATLTTSSANPAAHFPAVGVSIQDSSLGADAPWVNLLNIHDKAGCIRTIGGTTSNYCVFNSDRYFYYSKLPAGSYNYSSSGVITSNDMEVTLANAEGTVLDTINSTDASGNPSTVRVTEVTKFIAGKIYGNYSDQIYSITGYICSKKSLDPTFTYVPKIGIKLYADANDLFPEQRIGNFVLAPNSGSPANPDDVRDKYDWEAKGCDPQQFKFAVDLPAALVAQFAGRTTKFVISEPYVVSGDASGGKTLLLGTQVSTQLNYSGTDLNFARQLRLVQEQKDPGQLYVKQTQAMGFFGWDTKNSLDFILPAGYTRMSISVRGGYGFNGNYGDSGGASAVLWWGSTVTSANVTGKCIGHGGSGSYLTSGPLAAAEKPQVVNCDGAMVKGDYISLFLGGDGRAWWYPGAQYANISRSSSDANPTVGKGGGYNSKINNFSGNSTELLSELGSMNRNLLLGVLNQGGSTWSDPNIGSYIQINFYR